MAASGAAPATATGATFWPSGSIDAAAANAPAAPAPANKVRRDSGVAGVSVVETERGLKVSRKGGRVKAVDVVTEPFPGFPTDLQAQMMALLCTADGVSVLEEKIFENRFMHAPELVRMGAKIDVHGGHATVMALRNCAGRG